MVSKRKQQQFIDRGGYNIVTPADKKLYDDNPEGYNGKWKNLSQAARETGVSRPFVYEILSKHPTPPKGEPQYYKQLEESKGFKQFKEMYGSKSQFKRHRSLIRKAFTLLNKKGVENWTEADYRIIWKSPQFTHPDLDDQIPEATATCFHNLMRATGKTNLLLSPFLKGVKFGKGKKKGWFLRDQEIVKLTETLQYPDTVLMVLLGISKGARFSSLQLCTPQKTDFSNGTMEDFEPKMKRKGGKAYVTRYLPENVMGLLKQYMEEFHIKGDTPFFNRSGSSYNLELQRAAAKAGIVKKPKISSHILKHTFVTQAANHGVGAELIERQTGTEWRTLSDHYKAENPAKMAHAFQGKPLKEKVTFVDWIDGLFPMFELAYNRTKSKGAKLDGVVFPHE